MELEAEAMLSALLDDADGVYDLPKRVKERIVSLQQSAVLSKIAELPMDEFEGDARKFAREATDLSYKIEHTIDNFSARISAAQSPGGRKGLIGRLKSTVATAMVRGELAASIKKLEQDAKALDMRPISADSDSRNAAAPVHTGSSSTCASAADQGLSDVPPDELVGLDARVEELVEKIMPEEGCTSSNQQVKVVSIVGPAGVGKTTLAKALYDRLAHEQRFDCAAWVTVSTQGGIIAILEDLLRQITHQHQPAPPQTNLPIMFRQNHEIRMRRNVRQALQDKRYFVAFDNVWNPDEWLIMKDALIDGRCGSAVVMTTRNVGIARSAGGVYTLAPLSKIDSRKLFYKIVFHPEEKCRPELAEISEKIIEKCAGIPLFIMATAGILKSKTLKVEDWHAAHDSIDDELVRGPNGIRRILYPSLSGLPVALRRCFFYLSLFPRGYTISGERLVWGWVAERLVKASEAKTAQEVGQSYLKQLVDRNLIVPLNVDAGGKVLSCRVHDVVHSFIVSLSTKDNFVTISDGRQGRSFPDTVHRLSIQGNNVETCKPQEQKSYSHVRSLVVSGDVNLVPSLSEFQELRVLDLGACDSLHADHLKDIGKLFYLKCLVLGGKRITHVPKEIRGLKFLQTLDLRATSVKEFSESAVLPSQLKRLYVNSCTKLSDEIGKIQTLEELADITISNMNLLKEICSLINLRVLRISIWSWDESYDHLSFLFMGMPNLHSLSIWTSFSLDVVQDDNRGSSSLQNLEIRHSTFIASPKWISSLKKLSSLSIEVNKLSQEIIGILGQLQCLLVLSLTSKDAPDGTFGSNTDTLQNLTNFQFVSNAMGNIFGPGAMPKLERLDLSFQASQTKDVFGCFEFGLENLSSIEHVHVQVICFNASLGMVKEAEDSIRRLSCSRWLEIQRVREKDMIDSVCSQVACFDLIQTFNSEQRQAIENVGFGNLLKMKSVTIRHELCKSLADVYDTESEAFNIRGSMLKISIEDVGYLMGLPSDGKEIVEAPQKKNTDLLSFYEEKTGTAISFDTLLDYFRNNKGHDEHFVRTVLLYTIGVLICPTTHRSVSCDYLNLVEKVEEIKTVNWASLTLHHLKASIAKYKTGKAILEGNLALLQLWYWEKIYVNKPENIDYSGRERPLLQYWDEEKACERDKYTFGEGKIVEDIKNSGEFIKSSESADDNKSVSHDLCVRPNASEVGGELTQLMIDHMYLQLQLLNHDSKVKDVLTDIRLNDTDTVQHIQAARDRVEVLMKQVLDVGYGPFDKSGIVERFYNLSRSDGQHKQHLHTHTKNSTIGKTVREPAGRESTSTSSKSNATMNKTREMENPVLEENTCTGKDILVHIEDVCIPKETMEILTREFLNDGSEKYLDDKIVNAGIYCLRHKFPKGIRDGGKVFLEKPDICQLLQRDAKHQVSQDGTEKEEIIKRATNYLNHDMIFLPLNWEGKHWYLAVVSAKQHEVLVLDSVESTNTERGELKLTLEGIEIYLELAAQDKTIQTNRWKDSKVTSWEVRMVEGLPKQKDGSSCGLFMLKYMEYWTGARLSTSFTQDDINQFRRDLASLLANSPLNKIKKIR